MEDGITVELKTWAIKLEDDKWILTKRSNVSKTDVVDDGIGVS